MPYYSYKQVSNYVKESRDEDTKVQSESVRSRNGVSTSCEKNHKKELEQLEKENYEIIEELQQWVEDGDHENKTLEEIIEKNNDENVKLLVQISVMKKEMKALEKKNEALQTELDMLKTDFKSLSFQVDALEKEVADFETGELDYKKLRDETSSLIDQLEIQLDTFINENAMIIIEKDNEINELKKQKDQLEDQLASLTKEDVRIISDKAKMVEIDDEKSTIINQLEDQLAPLKKENPKMIFLNERLQEEKLRAFDHFKDRLALFTDDNAKIISVKDKEINEIKNQKSRAIDQPESEKWSIIG